MDTDYYTESLLLHSIHLSSLLCASVFAWQLYDRFANSYLTKSSVGSTLFTVTTDSGLVCAADESWLNKGAIITSFHLALTAKAVVKIICHKACEDLGDLSPF